MDDMSKTMKEHIIKKDVLDRNMIQTIKNLILESWNYCDDETTILNERFYTNSVTHDWRNYVDNELKENWQKLSEETRLVIYLFAARQANSEEWD